MLTTVLLLSTAALVAVDQLTKIWAAAELGATGRIIEWLPGVFELHYTENRGVAFSMLQDQRWVFIPITVLIATILLVMMLRSPLRRYTLFNITTALILSGAIGNLIDRIAYGYVIDFLYFKLIDFPIFNFADCCVVVGACLLFVFVLFVMKEDDNTSLRTLFFGIKKGKKENNDG